MCVVIQSIGIGVISTPKNPKWSAYIPAMFSSLSSSTGQILSIRTNLFTTNFSASASSIFRASQPSAELYDPVKSQ